MTTDSDTAPSRRTLLKGVAAASVGLTAAQLNSAQAASAQAAHRAPAPSTPHRSERIVTKDGTSLYVKDWGFGPPVVFSHGYPLSADAWEDQMFFLLQNGYRVIAHDRRGFGRSGQPSGGYDYDTFADDLALVIETLDLNGVTLVGHSMGGGEVARYIARHGQSRVARVAFVAAVTPFLLQTPTNPNGAPKTVFDQFRAAVQENRAQWNLDVTMPYYGYNRPGAHVSEAVRQNYWQQGQQTGFLAAYHALGAFSETDFRPDLAKITVPALVIHGDDDQIVPLEISGRLTAQILPHARLVIYEGGSHGLLQISKERLNKDLLSFLRG